MSTCISTVLHHKIPLWGLFSWLTAQISICRLRGVCVCVFHCCTCILQATASLITSAETQWHSLGKQLPSNTQFRAAIEHRDVQGHDSNGMLWGGEGSFSLCDKEFNPLVKQHMMLSFLSWGKSCPDIAVYIHPPECINPLELLRNNTTKASTTVKQ